MTKDMTQGSPLKLILAFAVPLMLGSLFQQFYNLADTIIVGRFVGVEALAAVGSVGVDTAGTLVKAAEVLMDKGAASVRACATHAVLSGPAYDRINNSCLKEVFVTDTIPLKEGADTSKIKVVSMAETFAAIIRKVYNYQPISTEFIF